MIDETPQSEDKRIALDPYVPLLEALAEAKDNVKFWQEQKEKHEAALAKIMGDAVIGTVDGLDVVTYRPIEQFRGGEFEKMYPDTYRAFTHEVTRKVFDHTLLRATRPELWKQFQSRPMKSSYIPRDKAQ